jgi:rhomboid protease GluP
MENGDIPGTWTAPSRREADDWSLVLMAADIPHKVERSAEGWALTVPWSDRERAARELAHFHHENPQRATPGLDDRPEYGKTGAGLVLAGALLAFYTVTGPRVVASSWFRAGRADAVRILDGEAWRTVTALTLHADNAHVIGNVASCAIFVTAVCRELGPGVGLWLVLLAGAIGNACNAVAHGDHHSSVGASTALFGAIGILAGLQFTTRRHRRSRTAKAWLPLAGGLALLAMLGTGDNADIGAHLFGFLVGVPLGIGTHLSMSRPLAPSAQWMLTVAAAAIVVWCWRLAFVLE